MHAVVSCSFIHHRSSICSDHVPSSTAEYQLTNTVKIKQCSCVMQGLSILSFGNNLCILHKNLLFSVSLAKWAVVPLACEFSSIHWPRYHNGSLELRRSRFQSLYCHVKHTKTAKGVSFFPSFSNDSCFKLVCLRLECQCFLEISTYLGYVVRWSQHWTKMHWEYVFSKYR